MIKSVNTVRIHERDGKELPPTDIRTMDVASHSVNDNFVVLFIAEQVITVSAHDLRAAINNAVNTAKH